MGNVHDSKTILATIDQIKKLTGEVPKIAATDQGNKLRKKSLNKYEKIKIKKMLRRRYGIEGIISSLEIIID